MVWRLWDHALLYALITVTDPQRKIKGQNTLDIFFDFIISNSGSTNKTKEVVILNTRIGLSFLLHTQFNTYPKLRYEKNIQHLQTTFSFWPYAWVDHTIINILEYFHSKLT